MEDQTAPIPDSVEPEEFARLFEEEGRELLLSRLRVGLGVGIVLYSLFSGLDWLVVPELWWDFLLIRAATVVLAGVFIGISFTEFGRTHARGLALGIVYAGAAGIVLMTTMMNGFESNYFVGIMLVTFLVGLFLPWGVSLTVTYSVAVCGTYVSANLGVGGPTLATTLMPVFFLLGTCLLTCWATWALDKSRKQALRMRLALEVANEGLKELDKAKTSFFANVSHELRTPLMLILGPLEQIISGATNDPQPLLKSMDANAHRLLRQVNMILNFSKLEAGRQDCNRELGQVGEILEQLVSGATPYANQRGMTLVGEGFDSLPELPFDPEQVETAVANLLSNAMKFTPDDGTVSVHAGHEGDIVWIEVADTGCGITEADVALVFERFHQVDGGKGGKIQGTGLGLALSKELIALHGGQISVTSELGTGTTFRITLPTLEASDWTESAAQDPATEKRGKAVQTVARANATATQFADLATPGLEQGIELEQAGKDAPLLLVVEDNPDMRAFVSSALAQSYRVITADDGAAGLEEARKSRPDMIVSDVQMPVMDGFEMVAELRKDKLFDLTPIIMLTAKTGSQAAVKGLNLGAVDYIGKPFEVSELQARVAAQLRMAAIERTLDERDSRLVAVGQMTGSIAHDMRGPLTAIFNRIELLRMVADVSGKLEDYDDDLTAIEGTVTRINNMIQELLEFVRGNNVTLNIQETDLGEFMTELCEEAETSLGHVGVVLDHEQNGKDGISLKIDRDRITRVLENLVNNSRDAIMQSDLPHEGRVWIRTSVGQDRVVIRVADNGPGIPEGAIKELFQPFTTAGKPNGTGLGLAIALNLVTAHDGTIDVDNDPPEGGAAFEIMLPCSMVVAEQHA
jgi:signal transduction histidine kinase